VKRREDKHIYFTKRFKYIQLWLADPESGEKHSLFMIHQAEARKLAKKLQEVADQLPDPTFLNHEYFATEGAFPRDLPTRDEVVDPEYGINTDRLKK